MKKNYAILSAILAAALYAINAPASKLLLQNVPPSMMAALLYLGAGLGMLAMGLVRRAAGKPCAGLGNRTVHRLSRRAQADAQVAQKLYLCGTDFAAGKSLSRFFLNNPSVHRGKTVL